MKKIIAALSLGLILFSCTEDKIIVGNKTTIETEAVIDKGKVMQGEEVKASIKVKNTGKYPLILAEVSGSCSCTVAEYTKDPVPPGETATIQAIVKTDKAEAGPLAKDVKIVANTDPSITSVVIRATVIRK